jgi:hypothetical protein
MTSLFLLMLPLWPCAVTGAFAPRAALLAPLPPPAVPPGAHPRPLPDEAEPGGGSPLSPRAVAERSRSWEWKRLEVPGWKLLMAEHFVLRGDVPVEELRKAGAYLEAFHREGTTLLGGDPGGIMFSVRVYKERHEFRRYAAALGAANAESLYDPRQGEIVICLEGAPGAAWIQKTLAHEFVHAYMDRVWKRTGPLWLAEGAAEYFANYVVREGRVEPGAPDRRALLLLEIDPPLPLRDFLRLGRAEMYGLTYAHHYAQAWSFVHYLFSRPGGLGDLLVRGELPEDLDLLEAAWRRHLKALQGVR